MTAGSAPAWARYRALQHFPSLDGLRALAIIVVIWHHAPGHDGAPPLLRHGFLGVDLFFVLSGFLIVTLLLRERDKYGAVSLKEFYLRRTFRIFPLYFGIVALLTLRFAWLQPDKAEAGPFLAGLPYYLSYTSNFVHTEGPLELAWSLAAEEQFYLLWSIVEAVFAPFAPVVCALGVGLNQLFAFGLLWPSATVRGLQMGQITFTPILLGVGLAHLLHRPQWYERLHRVLGRRAAPAILLSVVLLLAAPLEDLAPLRPLIQLTMAALLGSCLMSDRHLLSPLLEAKPIVRIGVVSYGLYLLHPYTYGVAEKLRSRLDGLPPAIGALAAFATMTVLSMVLAELSFRYFEAPFLRIKQRFRR